MKVSQINARKKKGLNALYSDSSCQALHPETLFACVRAPGHRGDHLALGGTADASGDRRRGPKLRYEWPREAAIK